MSFASSMYDPAKAKEQRALRRVFDVGRKAAALKISDKVPTTTKDLQDLGQAQIGLAAVVQRGEDLGMQPNAKTKGFGVTGSALAVAGLEFALGPAGIFIEAARTVAKISGHGAQAEQRGGYESFAAESDARRNPTVGVRAPGRGFNYAQVRRRPAPQADGPFAHTDLTHKQLATARALQAQVDKNIVAVQAQFNRNGMDLTQPGMMTDRAEHNMNARTVDRIVGNNGFGNPFDTGHLSQESVKRFTQRDLSVKPYQMMALAPGLH